MKKQQIQAERDAKLKANAQKRREEVRKAANTPFNKYAKLLNMDAVSTTLKAHKAVADQVNTWAEDYAPDHVSFLKSDALKAAFDHYHEMHEGSGIAFGIRVGEMVIGMGGTQAGETQLLAWLKDTGIGERNWLLKGFAFNQAKIKAASSTLLTQYKEVPLKGSDPNWTALEQVAQASKAVPDLMDKMLDAIEESSGQGGKNWFAANKMGMALASYVPLMQGALKFANPTSAERKLAQAYMGFMNFHHKVQSTGFKPVSFSFKMQHRMCRAWTIDTEVIRSFKLSITSCG